MNLPELSDSILEELSSILHQIHEEDAEKLVAGILSSDRIFVAGMGRSGLVARSFAMRLMQIGICVFVVGDSTTPAMGEGDLLIVISGSGETEMSYHIATAAKRSKARVFLLTVRTISRIGDLSDLVLVLPNSPQSILPLMSAFEVATQIFLDVVILLVMEETGVTEQEMMKRHSNLE